MRVGWTGVGWVSAGWTGVGWASAGWTGARWTGAGRLVLGADLGGQAGELVLEPARGVGHDVRRAILGPPQGQQFLLQRHKPRAKRVSQ